ncbi:MAG: CaiB/BaiF CoA transferase family protein [Acidimicrobiia bacterium]
MGDTSGTSALGGLFVVDFSNAMTGAHVSQIFADLGADVVHVEPPGGSPLRSQAAYPFWARGKKSVEIDLATADGMAFARSLAATADVVIETFGPGRAERFGLGYAALAAVNPRLVYGSVTGFGHDGPLAHIPGYEALVAAKFGALASVADMSDRAGPSFISVPYASYPAAQLLAQGLFAALYEREHSGHGQRVDSTLAQGLTVHDSFGWYARIVAQRYSGGFQQAPIAEKGIPSGGLSFRLLIALTADGKWLQFSQTAQRLFVAMMRAMELDWMFDDSRFRTAPDFDDVGVRVEFWERMLAVVRSKTVAEWAAVFDAHPDVWGEMFRGGVEILDHPQMVWNGSVAEVVDTVHGPIRQPGELIQFSDTPAVLTSAPLLNEHADEARARVAGHVPPPVSVRAPGSRPPLEGIVCLELGTYYAAPYGATLLGEFGARVIKVEQLDGDPMRNMLPFPEIAGIKALQGKESLGVDVATEEGRRIVHELVAKADIVLQSFRAGVAERLGLDADSLRKINPNIVYHCAPGYGTGGPCGHRPAYAPTIGAGAGLAWRNAGASIPERDDLSLDEVKNSALRLALAVMGVGNSDGLSSVTVGTALALGLYVRERGRGSQNTLTTMLQSTAHTLSETTVAYPGQVPAPRADADFYGLNDLYRLYETADGWVFLAAPTETRYRAVVEALGLSGDRASIRSELERAFMTRTAAEWERDLLAVGIGCVEVSAGPVDANYQDPGSFGERMGLVTTATHPILDEHPRLVASVTLSRSASVTGGGCLVGAHTGPIMTELGYSAERQLELRAAGVIGG